MANTKTTKRAFFSSVVALLLSFAMLLGTTFAWFTDSAVSGSNVITAGNLDVVVEYTLDGENWKKLDGADDLFKKGLWEPGHTEVVALKITNNGSLALKYNANMNIVSETKGKTKDNKDIVLSDILTVDSIIMDTGVMGDVMLAVAFRDESTLQYENTAYFKDANVLGADQMLLAGTSNYLIVKVDMSESVGNEANHKGIGFEPAINFGINVHATQFTYERDSFGSDYDEGLDPEAIYVFDPQSLKDAMLVRDGYIVLDEDIIVDETTPLQWGAYMFVANGREVTIDLNGHDIVVEEDALLKTNAVFTTANGGTLNIVGEGNVIVKNGKSGIFHAMNKDDQINVYGGTYTSNSDNGSNALAIIYTNSGNVDVYGGVFRSLDGVECANAEDKQGNRLSIVFHEGAILKHTKYYAGYDASRIQLAQDCYLKNVQVDGEEWWQVAKAEDAKIINTFEDMIDVCKNGGKMVLAKDITYTADNTEEMIGGSIFLVNGKNVTVDLNGHNITIDENATHIYGAIFFVGNPGGHIDIVGDGEITVKNGLATVVWVLQGGTANIYGGTYTSNSVSNEAMIYSQGNGGVVNVYGGKYTYDLDRHLNGGFNVSDQAGNALRIIIHEGVLLSRPEYSQHLQGTTNGEQNRIQLAEGCTLEEVVIDGETWYQVVKA